MFSTLRNRFGIPGVISVIALVFAMIGGAYAANHNSGAKATASAGKRGPRGPKGATGPAGPAGPAGAQGAAGAKGNDGAPGLNGATGPTGAAGATGATGKQGLQGLQGATGPTGPEGAPWTAGGTLPSGESESGHWALYVPAKEVKEVEQSEENNQRAYSAVSFTIPYPGNTPPEFNFVQNDASTEACPGTAANPTAAPGNLCLYEQFAAPNFVYLTGLMFASHDSRGLLMGGYEGSEPGK